MFPLFAGRRREFPGCSRGVGGTSACYPAPAESRTSRRAPASLGGAHCRMPPPLATLVLVVSTVLSIAGEFSVLLYYFLLADRSTAGSVDYRRISWRLVHRLIVLRVLSFDGACAGRSRVLVEMLQYCRKKHLYYFVILIVMSPDLILFLCVQWDMIFLKSGNRLYFDMLHPLVWADYPSTGEIFC